MSGPTPPGPGFFKFVSPLEMVYLTLIDLRPPIVNQLVVEGVGRLTLAALQEALDLATAVNPGCRLRLDTTGPLWSWSLGPAPRLRVVDAPAWSGRDPDQAPFLLAPLDPYQGPSCELLWVQTVTAQYLVFRSLHAVMDGSGTWTWAKEVFRALRQEALLGHPSTLTTDELEAELSKGERVFPRGDALHPFGRTEERNRSNEYRWQRVTVDRPLLPSSWSRLAIALARQARTRQSGLVRIQIPTDLRAYRPETRSTGNLSGLLWVEPTETTTSEGLSLALVKQLYEKRPATPPDLYQMIRGTPYALVHFIMATRLEAEHASGLYPFSAMISHLGQLTAAECSGPDFSPRSAFYVPIFADWACYLVLSGFEQTTEVSVALPGPFTRNGELEALAALVVTTLEAD